MDPNQLQNIVFNGLVRMENSPGSPYEGVVSTGKSGLSFGAMQNDVGDKRHLTKAHSGKGGVSLLCKILTAFLVLVAVSLQIYSPAHAAKTQDHSLILAVRQGNIDEAKRLFAGGTKVDVIDAIGNQPIHIAARLGNIEFVHYLLTAGAKVDAAGAAGLQPIHIAAQEGNVELVRALFAAGAKIDAKSGYFGAQPIHYAVQSGNVELVKMLLAAGADVEANDNKGRPPFYYIIGKGDPAHVKMLLLSAGATAVPTQMDEWKPIWMTTACYKLNFSAGDKLDLDPTYNVKYIVRNAEGEVYIAEKTAQARISSSSEVIFPDGFHDQATNLSVNADCNYGQKYIWEIYANDKMIDSGTFEFKRTKTNNK